jgi:hypothetical protein
MPEAERRRLEITYSPGCLKLTDKQKTLEMTFQMNQADLYAHVVTTIKLIRGTTSELPTS